MWLLDFLQNLPLAAMFLCTLGIALAFCWTILVIVRLCVRILARDSTAPLPIRDTIIGALSAIFALMMAFSAAGIWSDTLHAHTAVQREANALKTSSRWLAACRLIWRRRSGRACIAIATKL